MMFEAHRIRKAFPGVVALDDVSLSLRPGAIHALVGENGAGKSTLIKIITGVYRTDAGALRMDGAALRLGSPQDAIKADIGVVYQERNLIPRFTVGENIMLERLPTRGGMVDCRAKTAARHPLGAIGRTRASAGSVVVGRWRTTRAVSTPEEGRHGQDDRVLRRF